MELMPRLVGFAILLSSCVLAQGPATALWQRHTITFEGPATSEDTTPNPFRDYEVFKILAQGFEDTGVRAYKGQVRALKPYDAFLTADGASCSESLDVAAVLFRAAPHRSSHLRSG